MNPRHRGSATGSSPWWLLGLAVAFAASCSACGTAPPTASSGPTLAPTVVPATPTSVPTGPSSGDLETATALLNDFMKAVSSGNADVAWAMLAPVNQAAYASKAKFASDWQAFMKSANGQYTMGTISQDPAQLAQWIPSDHPGNPAQAHAFIVEVDYPRLAHEPAGFSILVAAPTSEGWRVWEVR